MEQIRPTAINVVGTAVVVYILLSNYRLRQLLGSRPTGLLKEAADNGWEFYKDSIDYLKARHSQDFTETTLDEVGKRDIEYRNFVVAPEWTYYELSWSKYRHYKGGEYKSVEIFYGVMMAQLPRKLPNVFFDSLKARRRQFRLEFKKRQLASLEGDFDKYFATYFPENYAVDSMSFISPDVMWALKDAAAYDIEIVDDYVYIYGPLLSPPSQLGEMSSKLLPIKKQLLDNIGTYLDERLPKALGWKQVTVQAAKLERSLFWTYVSWGFFGIYFIIYLWAMTHRH